MPPILMLQLQSVLYGILPVVAALVLVAAADLFRAAKRTVAVLLFVTGIVLAVAALTDWQAAVVMLAAGVARWRFRVSAPVLLLAGAVFGGLSVMWAD